MVYQTWAYGPQGDPVAAGTWTPDASGHAAAPVTADVARTLMLAVTVEPAGGSPQPTSQPLTRVEL
jgi:anti-sigma-K factor RskA